MRCMNPMEEEFEIDQIAYQLNSELISQIRLYRPPTIWLTVYKINNSNWAEVNNDVATPTRYLYYRGIYN